MYLGERSRADGLPDIVKSELLDAVQVVFGLLLVLCIAERACQNKVHILRCSIRCSIPFVDKFYNRRHLKSHGAHLSRWRVHLLDVRWHWAAPMGFVREVPLCVSRVGDTTGARSR